MVDIASLPRKFFSLRFLPKVMSRMDWTILGAVFVGIPACVVVSFLDPLKGRIEPLLAPLIAAIISIALIFGSIFHYLAEAVQKKRFLMHANYSLALVVVSVILALASYLFHHIFYFSIYFLMLGVFIFLDENRAIISERTMGATLLEAVTYKQREQRTASFEELSSLSIDVFQNRLKVKKGETVLVNCEYVQDARTLAARIVDKCDYAVYIVADQPHDMIGCAHRSSKGKLFCIDCFTHLYGLGEFADPEKHSMFYSLKSASVRELHDCLRKIRRRVVSKISAEKDWHELSYKEKKEVEAKLASGRAIIERKKNVWIIYDSISSLAAVFDLEALTRFLIHDNTVDATLGRNTILFAKNGALDATSMSRIESFCEHILDVRQKGNRLYLKVKRSSDFDATAEFDLEVGI